jgi:tRNA uridine 5-carbamoylmethylation protein Kti12
MEKHELLENLITEGEILKTTINFVPSPEGVMRMYSVYSTNQGEKYERWKSSVQRFIKSYYPSDLDDFKDTSKKISPESHRKILGLLSAIKLLPLEPVTNKIFDKKETNITIHNTQNNTQSVVFNIIIDAIKDEITGKDLKELKELIRDYEKEPEKDKSKLIDRIKNFGTDVLTNMIANILTNPNIYNGLI